MKYSINDFNIGDEVTLRSKNSNQPDYNMYWIVYRKMIMIY